MDESTREDNGLDTEHLADVYLPPTPVELERQLIQYHASAEGGILPHLSRIRDHESDAYKA